MIQWCTAKKSVTVTHKHSSSEMHNVVFLLLQQKSSPNKSNLRLSGDLSFFCSVVVILRTWGMTCDSGIGAGSADIKTRYAALLPSLYCSSVFSNFGSHLATK